MTITTLATDLDGTLIPVSDTPQQRDAIRLIDRAVEESDLQLVFVTGRSLELTLQAIETHSLPQPDSILCDVGSRVMDRHGDGTYGDDVSFEQMLVDRQRGWTNERISDELTDRLPELKRQPDSKQTRFKCSFDFAAARFEEIRDAIDQWIAAAELPLTRIVSVDPETQTGLLDILPSGVNKGFGLSWWAQREARSHDSIVFCGDSGNDSAAMSIGVNSVLVGNADQQVRQESRRAVGDESKLYCANSHGPEGVLEGLMHHLGRIST